MNKDTTERNEAIFKKRKAGCTFAALSKEYGISIERIRQIYLKELRYKILEEAYDISVQFNNGEDPDVLVVHGVKFVKVISG